MTRPLPPDNDLAASIIVEEALRAAGHHDASATAVILAGEVRRLRQQIAHRLPGHQIPAPRPQSVPVDGRGQDGASGDDAPAGAWYRAELFQTSEHGPDRPIVTLTKAARALMALQGAAGGQPVYVGVGHQWRAWLLTRGVQANVRTGDGWVAVRVDGYWMRTHLSWVCPEPTP